MKQLTKLDSAPRQQGLARGHFNKVGQHSNNERVALNAEHQPLGTDTPNALQKSTMPTAAISNVGHIGSSQPSTRISGVGQGDQREREFRRERLHEHN